MTDPRPRPQYGEYADVPPPPPPAPVVAEPARRERPRRLWDVALTAFLLLWGVWDVATGFREFGSLSRLLGQVYDAQGIDGFASAAFADEVGSVLNVVRAVLLVITIAVSLLLIARHRLAFWAPLAGAAVAGVAVTVGVAVIMLNDPGFLAYVQSAAP